MPESDNSIQQDIAMVQAYQQQMGVDTDYSKQVGESFEVRDDGTSVYRDIRYSEEYPNSYLDIYVPAGADNALKPLLFNIHGGGFALGDKSVVGLDFLNRFITQGYAVVTINYALAPVFHYPVPTLQAMLALEFISANGTKYGIDAGQMVLTGDSAGGQIAGQIANIITNPEYAKQVGISAENVDARIRGLIFNCALIDMVRFDETDSEEANALFGAMGRCYFGSQSWKTLPQAQQANVNGNIGTHYPPVYITDGNTGTFTRQAVSLAEELRGMGVKVTENMYPKSEMALPHGYHLYFPPELGMEKYAQDNMEKELAFLREVLG